MSTAIYNKRVLLEWIKIAEKVVKKRTELAKKSIVDRELEERMKYYEFFKSCRMSFLYRKPTIERVEKSLKNHAWDYWIAASSYSDSERSLCRISNLCETTTSDEVVLDDKDVYLGLVRLGFNYWKKSS